MVKSFALTHAKQIPSSSALRAVKLFTWYEMREKKDLCYVNGASFFVNAVTRLPSTPITA